MIERSFFYKWVCLGILLLGLPVVSFACRCPDSISPTTAYRQADIVLLGKVMAVEGDINREGATARISVSEVWKKKIQHEINVSTATTCAFEFKLHEEYLLYLHVSPDGEHYTTKKCVGNLPISEAKDALDRLKHQGTAMEIEH